MQNLQGARYKVHDVLDQDKPEYNANVAAIWDTAEKFDPKTERLFRYLQVRLAPFVILCRAGQPLTEVSDSWQLPPMPACMSHGLGWMPREWVGLQRKVKEGGGQGDHRGCVCWRSCPDAQPACAQMFTRAVV